MPATLAALFNTAWIFRIGKDAMVSRKAESPIPDAAN